MKKKPPQKKRSKKSPLSKREQLLEYIRLRSETGNPLQAAELVAWDDANGRTIFDWDDAVAGAQWREQQARNFLRSIETELKGYDMVALYGINGQGYYRSKRIRESVPLRAQAMAQDRQQFLGAAANFHMWKVTDAEWADLVAAATKAARG